MHGHWSTIENCDVLASSDEGSREIGDCCIKASAKMDCWVDWFGVVGRGVQNLLKRDDGSVGLFEEFGGKSEGMGDVADAHDQLFECV